jgi:hypothetical protein
MVSDEYMEELFKESDDYVDLYQLFDYIRDKRMGDQIPFIKYGDITIDDPFMVIALDPINQNKVPKSLLKDWVGLTKLEDRRFNGLQIKKYIKNYASECKYNSIKILRNGTITFTVSYSADNKARLEDVVRTKVFVSDINQWEAIARAHGERFGHIQPANTMVEAKLVGDGYLVEIEVDAIVN